MQRKSVAETETLYDDFIDKVRVIVRVKVRVRVRVRIIVMIFQLAQIRNLTLTLTLALTQTLKVFGKKSNLKLVSETAAYDELELEKLLYSMCGDELMLDSNLNDCPRTMCLSTKVSWG
jgi:hypothetical protein